MSDAAAPDYAAALRARPRRPLVIAHRGAWGPAPENSCAALTAAAGLDAAEVDVRLAADGVPVLMHDDSLARMCGLDRAVAALPMAELAGLPLRAGAGGSHAPLTDQTLPALSDALAAAPLGLFLDLDVKRAEEVPAVARWLVGHPARARCALKIDVADAAGRARLAALRAEGAGVFAKVRLRGEADLELLTALAADDVAAAEVWFADPDLLARAARIGPALLTYTLREVHCAGLSDARALADPAAVWGLLRRAGVRGIMTDHPAALARFLSAAPEAARG